MYWSNYWPKDLVQKAVWRSLPLSDSMPLAKLDLHRGMTNCGRLPSFLHSFGTLGCQGGLVCRVGSRRLIRFFLSPHLSLPWGWRAGGLLNGGRPRCLRAPKGYVGKCVWRGPLPPRLVDWDDRTRSAASKRAPVRARGGISRDRALRASIKSYQ